MDCGFDRELLNSYADGVLMPELVPHVESHLPSCEDCRVELEDIRMIGTSLSGLPRERAPQELIKRILAQHTRTAHQSSWVTTGRILREIWNISMRGFSIQDEREAQVRAALPEWVVRWVLYI